MTDHRNESHPRLGIAEVNGNLSLHDFLTHVISLCSSGIDRTGNAIQGREAEQEALGGSVSSQRVL